jgi:hypothetical protein
MRRQLFRVAMLFYPAGWRRRYGGELEQMILDFGAEDASLAGSARMLIDLTGSGLAVRARSYGTGTRIAVLACVCAAAAIAVDASYVTQSTSSGFPITPTSGFSLSANALLPLNVSEIHAPPSQFPNQFELPPQRVTVQFVPHSSRVVGVSGPPAETVLNPRTDKVISVRLKGRS